MTEPKRWSSPDSDVDPVLRSVLRYGRELAPSPAQLGAIVAGAAPSLRPPLRSRRPRALWSIAAIAAVFVAGAAFAGYAVSQRATPAPAPAGQPATPGPLVPKGAPAPRPGVPALQPAAAAPALPPVAEAAPAASHLASAPVRSAAPATSTQPPALDAARDAEILQDARRALASNPSRALNLTRDHELHFPASPLTEERQALQIEALANLGRRAEAAGALAGFTTRFPRSIHARRLAALGLP